MADQKIAILGDIHLKFNQTDLNYFNSSTYDYIFFVGDIANYNHKNSLKTWSLINQLTKKCFIIPGNHDSCNFLQLAGEAFNIHALENFFYKTQIKNFIELNTLYKNVNLGAYSLFDLDSFSLIIGRPFSMGGSKLSFPSILKNLFEINSLEDSNNKFKELINRSKHNKIIFLTHNGPFGLGSSKSSIWGRDFKEPEIDFGDKDLSFAIDYSLKKNKEIIAVIGGHMHHKLKGGGKRNWHLEKNKIQYINAAKVPRITKKNGKNIHHHICLELSKTKTPSVMEVFLQF